MYTYTYNRLRNIYTVWHNFEDDPPIMVAWYYTEDAAKLHCKIKNKG